MALFPCLGCGRPVDLDAVSCPQCGKPVKRQTPWYYWVLIVVVVGVMYGGWMFTRR